MRATGPAATVAGMTDTVATGPATVAPPRVDEHRGDESLDDYIARVERELKE